MIIVLYDNYINKILFKYKIFNLKKIYTLSLNQFNILNNFI